MILYIFIVINSYFFSLKRIFISVTENFPGERDFEINNVINLFHFIFIYEKNIIKNKNDSKYIF